MEMNEALIYLQEALGLSAKAKVWPGSARLPLHLRAIEVRVVDANGFSFLLASLPTGVGLPEAKRVYSQLALRAETPVVVSFPDADARQRKALVAQGIPFVCPGRQAFLPFMGTACTERGGAGFAITRPRCRPTRRLPQSGEQPRSHIVPMTFVVRLGFRQAARVRP